MLAGALRCALFAFEMVVISATIQIGLALPMAEYFHRVSFTGLSANLLIVPAMNAAVPVGFLAIFTGWRWIGALAGGLLRFSARVAEWHANLEPSWRVPDPPVWLVLAFGAALVVCTILIHRRILKWPAIGMALALFVLLLWQPWLHPLRTGMLEVTAIDVGQGDSGELKNGQDPLLGNMILSFKSLATRSTMSGTRTMVPQNPYGLPKRI